MSSVSSFTSVNPPLVSTSTTMTTPSMLLGGRRSLLSSSPMPQQQQQKYQQQGEQQAPDRILVVCRVRPASQAEIQGGSSSVSSTTDSNASLRIYARWPEEVAVAADSSSNVVQVVDFHAQSSSSLSPAAINTTSFGFDKVFGTDATQPRVFDEVAAPLVRSLFCGYNSSILAYGQTGSGKTFTMMGVKEDTDLQGIMPRIAKLLFDRDFAKSTMESPDQEDTKGEEMTDPLSDITISCSFMEIYLERVYDLLETSRNQDLPVHEEQGRGVYVRGLSEHNVPDSKTMLRFLDTGYQNRAVSSTQMNAESSRSHSIFSITMTRKIKVPRRDGTSATESIIRKSKLHLVDLAGSEKVSKTNAVGQTFEEAKSINKSLSALGNVVSALSEGRSFIPYRDSRLTRILQDSLGGNARTTLIINCSPAHSNVQETISTLRFGTRAKQIKVDARVNESVFGAADARLIQSLQKQLEEERMKSNSLKVTLENTKEKLNLITKENIRLLASVPISVGVLPEQINTVESSLSKFAIDVKQTIELIQRHGNMSKRSDFLSKLVDILSISRYEDGIQLDNDLKVLVNSVMTSIENEVEERVVHESPHQVTKRAHHVSNELESETKEPLTSLIIDSPLKKMAKMADSLPSESDNGDAFIMQATPKKNESEIDDTPLDVFSTPTDEKSNIVEDDKQQSISVLEARNRQLRQTIDKLEQQIDKLKASQDGVLEATAEKASLSTTISELMAELEIEKFRNSELQIKLEESMRKKAVIGRDITIGDSRVGDTDDASHPVEGGKVQAKNSKDDAKETTDILLGLINELARENAVLRSSLEKSNRDIQIDDEKNAGDVGFDPQSALDEIMWAKTTIIENFSLKVDSLYKMLEKELSNVQYDKAEERVPVTSSLHEISGNETKKEMKVTKKVEEEEVKKTEVSDPKYEEILARIARAAELSRDGCEQLGIDPRVIESMARVANRTRSGGPLLWSLVDKISDLGDSTRVEGDQRRNFVLNALSQLIQVQEQLVAVNTELKVQASATQRRLLSRNKLIEYLEKLLASTQRDMDLQKQSFEESVRALRGKLATMESKLREYDDTAMIREEEDAADMMDSRLNNADIDHQELLVMSSPQVRSRILNSIESPFIRSAVRAGLNDIASQAAATTTNRKVASNGRIESPLSPTMFAQRIAGAVESPGSPMLSATSTTSILSPKSRPLGTGSPLKYGTTIRGSVMEDGLSNPFFIDSKESDVSQEAQLAIATAVDGNEVQTPSRAEYYRTLMKTLDDQSVILL